MTEDDPVDRGFIARTLAEDGYDVREAASGSECLARVAERIPDAITLDLVMPGMSGFEVLDALRSDPATRQVPVIVVTARDLSREERDHLRGRVGSVLEKSRISPGTLLSEVGRTLARLAGTSHGAQRRAGTVTPARPAPAGGRRVLVVEDSEPAIVQVRSALESAGYTVDVARGGEEAIERMRSVPPDGIVLDLMMPRVDGFAVLERMRGTPATARTPVLILTAKDLTREDLGRLSANNVRQCIQKGDVDRAELIRQVGLMFDGGARRAAEPPPPPPPVPARSRRAPAPGELPTVLAVEDNPDNMTTLRAILGGRCRFVAATDGDEGLEAARRERPHVVLLDISLPKRDGPAVARLLRDDPSTRDIPIVALTAHAMKGDEERFLASGFDGYVAKPIDLDHLLGTLERLIGPLPVRADAFRQEAGAP